MDYLVPAWEAVTHKKIKESIGQQGDTMMGEFDAGVTQMTGSDRVMTTRLVLITVIL